LSTPGHHTSTAKPPRLAPGTRVVGGWAVGSLKSEDGPVQRCSAKGPMGQRALLEIITYEGREGLDTWMVDFIEEVETWGDAAGGPLLRILAAGRSPHGNMVLRVIERPPGVSVARLQVPVPAGRAVRIGGQVARALAATHARGLIHGEVNEQRIHVRGYEATLEPGGIRQQLRAVGASVPESRGPEVAPEALLGQFSRAADVYALGALLCRLLSGEPPGRGPEGGRLPGVAGEGAPELVDLVRRCLAHDPFERPRVDEVVAALQVLEAQLPVHSLSEEPTPPSLQRTVEPRVGPVDVLSPPAPPPAPDLRSVVPVADRTQAPTTDDAQQQVPTWAIAAAGVVLVLVLGALVVLGL